MAQIPYGNSFQSPYDPIAMAREHTLLIIDADEARAQKVARLLTLAGMRAIVASTMYHGFERFLQERFFPRALLIGKQEELATSLFARFYQRLQQDLMRETPVLIVDKMPVVDGTLLRADAKVSQSSHYVVEASNQFLNMIWKILPTARISLAKTDKSVALYELPKLGFKPRVSDNSHYMTQYFIDQLKAAKRIIPQVLWNNLLVDVGLAHFRNETTWSFLNSSQIIPPEYTTCLNRAVQFAHPGQSAQKAYQWANMVDAEVFDKAALMFIAQQAHKVIGQDLALRTFLNGVVNEINRIRGEKVAECKRREDGSFLFALYSTLFIYGFMGAKQPTCYVWQASFDRLLEITGLRQSWVVREIECSGQTHTGHCVFHFTPLKL